MQDHLQDGEVLLGDIADSTDILDGLDTITISYTDKDGSLIQSKTVRKIFLSRDGGYEFPDKIWFPCERNNNKNK